MANNEATRRQPQFTNTQYEIPSWQTPWCKPWYQRDIKQNDTPTQYKYNQRGHLQDCTCRDCEEDLERAFTPNIDIERETVNDIPRDRHEDITVQVHLEDLNINSTKEIPKVTPKKVYLFSELDEVTPTPVSSSNTKALTTTVNSSRTVSTFELNNCESIDSAASHESITEVFSNLATITNKSQNLQTRVNNFRGTTSSLDYKTIKDLLLALIRELSRIHSNVQWFQISKKMALDAIQKTLDTLEEKAKQAEKR